MINIENAERTLTDIRSNLRHADELFDRIHLIGIGDEFDEGNFEWYMEIAFLQVIVLSESLHLVSCQLNNFTALSFRAKRGIP